MASIGLTDYSNPKFEYYAPLYFDFQDIRMKMKVMDEELTGLLFRGTGENEKLTTIFEFRQ